MKSLQLALFDSAIAQEHDLIKETLLVATRCLGEAWQLVAPGVTNDLLCIWVATEQDLTKLQRVEKLCPANRLIVLTNIKLDTQAKWQLFIAQEKTYPTVLGLVNLLSRVQAHFFPDTPATQQRFDPLHSFTGILQTALVDGIARICSIPAQAGIYLLPNENTLYVNGDIETLIPMILSPRDQITVQAITDQELLEQVNYAKFSSRLSSYAAFLDENLFPDEKAKLYTRYSFTELIWFSTLIASQGRLLVEAAFDETLFLAEIPEFIHTHYPEFVADFSQLDNLTLTEILALATEKSRYEQINFYNACLLLPDAKRKAATITIQKDFFMDLELTLQEKSGQLSDNTIVIVAGSKTNAGKSTFCNTLGDSLQLNPASTLKVEYGEIHFGQNSSLLFYEIPWQKKLDSSTKVLCSNAWGVLVLINNLSINPFAELDYYLKTYKSYFNQSHIAIGVTRCNTDTKPCLADYVSYLESMNCNYPVLQVDTRELSDAVALVIALLKS